MKKKNKPLVSIIMNCHNGEKYLYKSLKSIAEQNFKDWELIFWDNCSTDNSKKIFTSFSDIRFKYYKSQTFKNLYEARNLALKKAQGKYISFLDVDDWWHKEKLKLQIEQFSKNKGLKISYTNFFVYYQKINKKRIFFKMRLPEGFITQKLLNNYCVGILTIMIKREVLLKNPFNKKFNIIGDFDLVIKLSKKYELKCIQKPLSFYRVHSENLSKKKVDLTLKEISSWIDEFEKKKQNLKYSIKNIKFNKVKLIIKSFFGHVVQW